MTPQTGQSFLPNFGMFPPKEELRILHVQWCLCVRESPILRLSEGLTAAFCSKSAVKTVSDLYLPVSGKISEFNDALEDQPELLNTDPYGQGWIIKVEMKDGFDASELLSAEQYQESLG